MRDVIYCSVLVLQRSRCLLRFNWPAGAEAMTHEDFLPFFYEKPAKGIKPILATHFKYNKDFLL
jgi:hypothetical protein